MARRDLRRWLDDRRVAYREAMMDELGLSDEEKFWLRQPEHFFVPVQVELYKQYGDRLDPGPDELRAWLSVEERTTLDALEAAAAADPLEAEGLMLLDRSGAIEPAYLLGRGSVSSRDQEVSLGFLRVLTRDATPEAYRDEARSIAGENGPVLGTTYRRAAVAAWLTDTEHGAGALLARVIVNRLWQHHSARAWSGRPTTSA